MSKEMQNPTLESKPVKKRRVKKLPDDFIILDENVLEVIQPVTSPEVIQPVTAPEVIQTATSPVIQTEDLGKKFEMGICMLYGIPYDGKYKYSMEEAEKLKDRLKTLSHIFPHELTHTAKNGSQYDFTGSTDETIKLSAKTTKKDGKVAPQVIGQPSRKKFCNIFGIDCSASLEEIKSYIEANASLMLEKYFDTTFDCPILYYNQHKDVLQFIRLINKVDWSSQSIQFTRKGTIWNESSSIKIGKITIGEFQVHNNRDCIKFRWSFENLLKMFKESFEITSL